MDTDDSNIHTYIKPIRVRVSEGSRAKVLLTIRRKGGGRGWGSGHEDRLQ